jgi:hypothetical protein
MCKTFNKERVVTCEVLCQPSVLPYHNTFPLRLSFVQSKRRDSTRLQSVKWLEDLSCIFRNPGDETPTPTSLRTYLQTLISAGIFPTCSSLFVYLYFSDIYIYIYITLYYFWGYLWTLPISRLISIRPPYSYSTVYSKTLLSCIMYVCICTSIRGGP